MTHACPSPEGMGTGVGAEGGGAYLPKGQIATWGDTSPPHTKKTLRVFTHYLAHNKWVCVCHKRWGLGILFYP